MDESDMVEGSGYWTPRHVEPQVERGIVEPFHVVAALLIILVVCSFIRARKNRSCHAPTRS